MVRPSLHEGTKRNSAPLPNPRLSRRRLHPSETKVIKPRNFTRGNMRERDRKRSEEEISSTGLYTP